MSYVPTRRVRKRTQAGLKAGAIANAFYLVVGLLKSGRIAELLLPIAERYTLLLTIVLIVLFGTLIGLVEGLIFSKFADKLPTHSIYAKAAIFFSCVWLLYVFIGRLADGTWSPALFLLEDFALQILASVIFSSLFKRWEK